MEGSCHCGAVHWRFEGVPKWATACNCSVCRRWGALWAYGFVDEKIAVTGATQTYAWNKKWIEFHFCARCACMVYWQAASSGADGRRYGAVNLRLATEPEAVQTIALVHHDTETMADLPADGMHVSDVWS